MASDTAVSRWLPWACSAVLAALLGATVHQLAGSRLALLVEQRGIFALAVLMVAGWCVLRLQQPLGAWALAALTGVVVISGNIQALFGLAMFVLASLGVGLLLGNRWDWPDEAGLPEAAEEISWFRIGLLFFLGLGLNSYAIWIAMHYEVNYPAVYFLAFGAEIVLARRWLRALGAWLWRRLVVAPPSAGQAAILLWALLYLPYALVSFYVWDELGVHLYIPKVVSLYGQFMYDARFPEGFNHSIIPKSTYTATFLMGGEMAVRLINFSLFVAAFWLVEDFARRRWGRAVAFWSTLTALSTPFLLWQFGGVFIDSFSLFSGALLLLFAFLLAERCTGKNVLLFFVVGVLAYLSKQMAVYLLLPLGVWVGWLLVKDALQTRSAVRLGYALAGAGCFILLLLPLIVSSQRALGYSGLYVLDGAIQKVLHLPPVDIDYRDGRWAYPLSWRLLYDLTFNGLRFTEVNGHSFGFSYFVFGAFSPLLFLNRALRKDAAVLLLVFLGAGSLWYALNGAYIRYFSVILPLGSVLLGLTLTELVKALQPNRWLARGGLVGVGLVFCLNFGVQLTSESVVWPYPLVPALTGNHEHSSSKYMLEEMRLFRYAAVKYGKNAKCLALGTRPVLYHADFHIQGLPYYTNIKQSIFSNVADAEELFVRIFAKERFTFIISPSPSGMALFDSPAFMNLVTREWGSNVSHLYIPSAEARARLLRR